MFRYACRLTFFFISLALVSAGCGGSKDRPALGQVHGRVTLDGQPVVHATVVFRPLDVAGRDSTGVTDEDGQYVLKYIRDDLGAAVGKHSVRISKLRSHDPKSETLPLRYNQKTTLEADVHSGNNPLDFPLTSAQQP